jgi:antitoxin CptB
MTEKIARLRWQCRRGMLELDAILQPFFERYFLTLSPLQQAHFELLLTCKDQDLFTWLIGNGQPQDKGLCEILAVIKSCTLYQT